MTITSRLYSAGKLTQLDFDPDEISEVINEPGTLVWLDVDNPTEDTMALLGKEFGFHELALEDCLHAHQRPKIEQYGDQYLVVAYGSSICRGRVIEHEVAVFVGHSYRVTVRKTPSLDHGPVVQR